jgi:Ca2+-binding RTX toxin-like protein
MAILTVGPNSTFPTIAAAMLAASPGDTIVLENGYSNETAAVTVNNLFFDGSASSTNILLQLAPGIGALTLQGNAPIAVNDNAANNTITGNGGDNVITVSAGIDSVNGGAGTDRLIVDYSADALGVVGTSLITGTIDGYQGAFSDLISHVVTFNNVDSFDVRTGSGNDIITTGGRDDIITVTGGADVVDGAGGIDRLVVNYSADTNNVISGPVTTGSTDGFRGTFSDGAGNTVTFDDIENFTVTTGSGNDTIATGGGDDVLNGGTGTDTMAGGAGNDIYFIDNPGDVVTENPSEGNDTENASVSRTLDANVENLILAAGAGAINGTGNGLANFITGNASDNVIDGGAGADTMAGGAGNDTYFVDNPGDVVIENPNEGNDTENASVSRTLDANVENLILAAGAGAINGTGNGLNNAITGNASDNVIDGATGADTMAGAAGNDTYFIDNPGDVVIENPNEGNDTENASVSRTLDANVENLILAAGAGAINGTGNGLDNTITGNASDNVIDGATGADTMAGAAGNDTYFIDNPGDVVIENPNEGNDTENASVSRTLDPNVENLILAAGAGAINGIGNGLDNTITGNASDNVIDGATGADTMAGGAGNDIYFVDNPGDVVLENPDEGIDTVISSVSLTPPPNVENLILAPGAGAANGIGNGLDNVIGGNASDNVIDGGAGADTMAGGAGNDTYFVDNPNDVVVENPNEGNDTENTSVSRTLDANVENLILAAGAGTINGTGNGLDNTITGNASDNVIDGAAGADTMAGGAGNDTYFVDNPNDVVVENPNEGNDTENASVSRTLDANVENLILAAGAGAINGTGNGLDNTITGNAADNVLDGAGGNDRLDGDGGTDTVVFSGARSDYTVRMLSPTTFQVVDNRPGGPDGVDTISNIELARFSDQTVVLNSTQINEVTIARPVDVNANGSDDLLWRGDDGAVAVWISNAGYIVPPPGPVGSAPISTTIEGTGDFDGDGRGDIMFRSASGQFTEWLMNGNHIDAIRDVGSTGSAWHVQGTGDFNGDHTDDILFRNSNDQLVTWLMQGGQIASIQTAGSSDPTSHVQGTGDFNGDGRTDVLFRSNDGHITTWLMNNGQASSVVAVGTAPTSAHIAGTGDFNGDGQTDILFRSDDGHVTAWLMNGGQLASMQDVGGTAEAAWHIQGTGDINGDGRDDILWHNADGHSTAVWFIDNAHLTSIQDLGGTPVGTHIGGGQFDVM